MEKQQEQIISSSFQTILQKTSQSAFLLVLQRQNVDKRNEMQEKSKTHRRRWGREMRRFKQHQPKSSWFTGSHITNKQTNKLENWPGNSRPTAVYMQKCKCWWSHNSFFIFSVSPFVASQDRCLSQDHFGNRCQDGEASDRWPAISSINKIKTWLKILIK